MIHHLFLLPLWFDINQLNSEATENSLIFPVTNN